MELGHWVTGQWVIWVIFHVRVSGSSRWPGASRPDFFRFSKKMPKIQNVQLKCEYTLTYLLTLSTTRVIDKILDSTRAVKGSIRTPLHISRHVEFIIEQGHRVNWVSGSLDSRVTGSLGHKMWPSSISDTYNVTTPSRRFTRFVQVTENCKHYELVIKEEK